MSEAFDSEEDEEREPVDLGLLAKNIEVFLNEESKKEKLFSTLSYLCDAYLQLGEAFEDNLLIVLNIIIPNNEQVISKASKLWKKYQESKEESEIKIAKISLDLLQGVIDLTPDQNCSIFVTEVFLNFLLKDISWDNNVK